MNPYYQSRKMPFNNPIANALVIIVGALAVGASLVLGFIAIVGLASLLAVLASVIGIRLWWFNRKFRRQGPMPKQQSPEDPSATVIEGEFRVVRNPEKDRNEPST